MLVILVEHTMVVRYTVTIQMVAACYRLSRNHVVCPDISLVPAYLFQRDEDWGKLLLRLSPSGGVHPHLPYGNAG